MPTTPLFQGRVDRLIGWARLILAAGSIIAVSVDPLQPAGNADLTYGVLAGYGALALIALVCGRCCTIRAGTAC